MAKGDIRVSDKSDMKGELPIRDLLDAMQDIFYAFDTDGNVIEYNQPLLDMSGYSADEVAEMDPWDFFPDNQRATIKQKVSQILIEEEPASIEADILTSTGEKIPCEFTGKPYYTNSGDVAGFVGIGRNISLRKEREQELKRTEEFLKQAQDVANLGCWELDFRADDLRWSEQTFRIHDLPPGEEPPLEDALDFFHPPDRETVVTALERLRREEIPYDLEVRINSAEEELKWVRTRGHPWYDRDNQLVGAIGTFQDITNRVDTRHEIEKQRDDLETLNQMLSHDLQNNLQVVTSRASLVEDRVDERVEAHIETIRRNADNAIDLIQSTRSLASAMLTGDKDLQAVPLKRILEAEIQEIRALSADGSLTIDGSIPPVSVMADNMLPSVFRNLLNNALEHNDKNQPEVTISVTEQEGNVTIHIADNGPGIQDSRRSEVFDKLHKGAESDGTGLGLHVVKTLVDNYGGDILVEDNEPQGAVFIVELPTAS